MRSPPFYGAFVMFFPRSPFLILSLSTDPLSWHLPRAKCHCCYRNFQLPSSTCLLVNFLPPSTMEGQHIAFLHPLDTHYRVPCPTKHRHWQGADPAPARPAVILGCQSLLKEAVRQLKDVVFLLAAYEGMSAKVQQLYDRRPGRTQSFPIAEATGCVALAVPAIQLLQPPAPSDR